MTTRPAVPELNVNFERPASASSLSGYIPTLDGWRALSIVAVLAHHLLLLVFREGAHPRVDPRQIGVAVFFTLSGFLITTLLLEERRRGGAISLRWFYQRRAFRILPPALAYLAAMFVLTKLEIVEVPARSFLACLTFWRYRFDGDWFTGHFWSLSLEEQFYLLWPALLVLTRTNRFGRAACASLIVLFTVWVHLQDRFLTPVDGNPNYWSLFILWGALAAMVMSDQFWRERLQRISGSSTSLLALGFVVFGYFSEMPGRRVLVPAAIAFLLLSTVLAPSSAVSRTLENPALRWLGRLSYSLYLWQQLFLVSSAHRYPFSFDAAAHPLVPILAAVACASASRYLIEKPFLSLGRRLFGVVLRSGIEQPMPALPLGSQSGCERTENRCPTQPASAGVQGGNSKVSRQEGSEACVKQIDAVFCRAREVAPHRPPI